MAKLIKVWDGTEWQNVAPAVPNALSTDGTQTLTNKTISGASNTLTNIPNAALTNSSITINGSSVSLGGSATIDALPSQSGNSGKYLTTNGTTASWGTIPSATGVLIPAGTGVSSTTITGTFPSGTHSITTNSSSSSATITISGQTYNLGYAGSIRTTSDANSISVSVPLSWTPSTFYNRNFSVAYGDGKFVTTNYPNSGNSYLGTSSNGSSWSAYTSSGFSGRINDIAYGAGLGFVACGVNGQVTRSTDGVTWTTAQNVGQTAYELESIATDGSTYRAIYYNSGANTAHIASSSNGTSWSLQDITGSIASGATKKLYFIDYANGYWFAGTWNGGRILVSSNGTSWSEYTLTGMPTGGYPLDGSATYGNGYYVVCGNAGYVYYSTNTTSWTGYQLSISGQNINKIIWDGTRFIAVADYGYALHTTNITSSSWSTVPNTGLTYSGSDSMNDIAYGGSRYVMVGGDNSSGNSKILSATSISGSTQSDYIASIISTGSAKQS